MRSSTLVFGANPQVAARTPRIPFQVPIVLPCLIAIPAAILPPRLIAVSALFFIIYQAQLLSHRVHKLLLGLRDCSERETISTDLAQASLIDSRNDADPQLCNMPALLHHSIVRMMMLAKQASCLPGIIANWEGVNSDKEEDVPVAAPGLTLLLAAAGAVTLQVDEELAPNDDNGESKYEGDIIEEDGNDISSSLKMLMSMP